MPWLSSLLCGLAPRKKKKKPRLAISPPLHLLLKPDADSQSHTFRCKVFKRPRPCNLCHQPIHQQGSCCRVCKFVCHKACENKPVGGGGAGGGGGGGGGAALTTQPRSASRARGGGGGGGGGGMDLSYVTERIIALWFPADIGRAQFRQAQREAAHMLHTKHGDNYMVFNLSEPRRALRQHHERVSNLGWAPGLAPPLERLCAVCKDIDSWLGGGPHRMAVLHSRGGKESVAVVLAAYMHYSNICGSADQALDRFAMARFLQDKLGDLDQPSHRRYVEYFSGLLSASIRINAAPLYLTHVTVLGAPSFLPDGGCRAFLKVYEGLVPVYTSGVHAVGPTARQFTVGLAGRGLPLRGDVLLRCYHRQPAPAAARQLIFACQFHTCAVADYTLSFTRHQLDHACNDLRFPLDGAVELHFSATPEVRLPSPAPTPAVPVDNSDDPVTRWDSFENISLLESPVEDSDSDADDGQGVNHTYGPLDGSLYATISKKEQQQQQQLQLQQQQQQQQQQQLQQVHVHQTASPPGHHHLHHSQLPHQHQAVHALTVEEVEAVASPHTVSMDSGISSAGNGLSKTSAPATATSSCPSTEEQHRALDALLTDMLLTVQSIPDLPPPPRPFAGDVISPPPSTAASPTRAGSAGPASPLAAAAAAGQCDDGYGEGDSIPYHARQDSRPFTYGAIPGGGSGGGMLASPSLVRKASFKGGGGGSVSAPGTASTTPTAVAPPGLAASSPAPASPPDSLSTSAAWDYRYSNGGSSSSTTSPRSPEFHDGTVVGSGSLTWLQRQQQKLRERREGQRPAHEARLLNELRIVQHRTTTTSTATASSSDAGYTSDHADLCTPLHINTAGSQAGSPSGGVPTPGPLPPHQQQPPPQKSGGSAPASPLLPSRASSRRLHTAATGYSTLGRQKSDSSFDRERPFVAVKRAHEQSRKYTSDTTQSSPMSPPHELIITRQRAESDSSGLLTTVDGPGSREIPVHHQQSQAQQHSMREESFSSWRTTSVSDEPGSPTHSSSPRPQTPAFPVHPRTPYVNNSTQQFEMASTAPGLPPKSPTTQRKDRSPSPVSDHSQTMHQQNISMISNSSSGVSSSSRIINTYQTTPHSSGFVSDGYLQQSPKNSAILNGSTGQSSPTVYYGHSRRSSLHSNSEPPQDVSPAHVKFVRDTSRFWYKPTISREEAINMLKDQPPGTFVVRDSNSFPGAFGLALKVATPPPNVQGKSSSSGDPASELVRHFLIEPTSRGVRLKGCSNEPVFSSLSALVYQHSLMPMALPCRLLLPEGDGSRLTAESPGAVSNAQLLLAQGAACNVLYLFSMDTESLTGPQAIKKTVQQLFTMQPLPLATVVHFKVSGQGITLTDNKRQLFFRRHYPVNTISYCGLDPDDHRWSQKSEETGMPISSNRCFGFVARKQASKTDNQCHIFAELEPEQPASAIVNFVSKVMMNCGNMKANIV